MVFIKPGATKRRQLVRAGLEDVSKTATRIEPCSGLKEPNGVENGTLF